MQVRYPRVWRLIVVIVVGICLVAGVAYVILTFFAFEAPSSRGEHAPIPTTQPRPTADSFSRMHQAFGPWRIVDPVNTASRRIALVDQNGSKEIGSTVITPDPSWQPAVIASFREIRTNTGTVIVRTASQAVFAIRVSQAFVLASQPETTYAFQPNGTLVSTSTQTLYKKEQSQ